MLEPFVVVSHSERIKSEILPCETTQLICFGLELIAGDCFAAVGFRPFVIFKIQFCQGRKK